MANWERQLRGVRDLEVDPPYVTLRLADKRTQRVRIDQVGEAYLLQAVVCGRAAADAVPGLMAHLWRRNRSRSAVGFRRDARRRLVGECWSPVDGDTLRLQLEALAFECDRMEQLLTGADRR